MNSRRKMVRRSLVAGIAALTCIALAVEAQMPDPNVQYPPSVNKEANVGAQRRAIEIAREVLK